MSRHRPSAAEQEARLAALGGAAEKLTAEDREALFAVAACPADDELLRRAAGLMSRLYPALAPGDPAFARRAHAVLMRALRAWRRSPAYPAGGELALGHFCGEGLALVPWQSVHEVVEVVECFYDAGLPAEEGQRQVRDLVKCAGWHFLRQGRAEEAFRLLTLVPVPAGVTDADFFRLRNALVLYEQRRVRRARRSLRAVLAGVLGFLVIASPLLLQLAENPRRVALGQGPFTFYEALYWSGETATTLGYGDVVPKTRAGRALAIFDSLLGMTAIAVTSGLILGAVTPRQLP